MFKNILCSRKIYSEAEWGKIYVFTPESKFICEAFCPERRGISRSEVASAKKSLQKRLIGSIGGPLGMVAGAYIGNYLGEKIGGLFDRLPEENAKALQSDRSLTMLKSENQCKISLDVNAEGANVSLRRVEDNSPENTMTSIDLSLGGRSYAL